MLWSAFDYAGLLGLDVFENETGPMEIQFKNRSFCTRDAPSVGMETFFFYPASLFKLEI